MMKDILRQLAVVLTTLAALAVNGAANAIPLNNRTSGEISDSFNVLFVPAGYVFSIWGLIYLGLAAYTVFQALPSQRANPRLRRTGWLVALSSLANGAWLFFWHFGFYPLTLVVMLVLLVTLVVIYLRLDIGRTAFRPVEKWTVSVPFSIYLGWITVATIANISDVLDFIKWDRFGIAPEIWMSILLAAVVLIAAMMNFSRRDVAYAAVLLWALAGISVKHAAVPDVATPTWITFGLVALTLAAAFFATKPGRKKAVS